MNIRIRTASREDVTAIYAMILELADFEQAPDEVTNTPEKMIQEYDNYRCFVAETEEDGIIGMALFYIAYYTWVGKSLYLDDLYVKPAFRGKKIGTKLLNEVIKIAKNENCSRVRWQVLDWNTAALNMYRNLGAHTDSEWINCDLTVNEINNFPVK